MGWKFARRKEQIVRRGEHLLRHMSCLQILDALSSEAEYYALIRGECSLGNSITLPRLDDRCSNANLQWQLSGKECCKKTWNRWTFETFADTSRVVVESGGAW